MLINLKPRERAATADEVIARLRSSVAKVPGITLYLQPVQDLTIDAESAGPSSGSRRGRRHASGSPSGCRGWSSKLQDAAAAAQTSPATSRAGPAAFVDIDRDTAARLGVSVVGDRRRALRAFGQRIVSTIFTETNQYRVILEA